MVGVFLGLGWAHPHLAEVGLNHPPPTYLSPPLGFAVDFEDHNKEGGGRKDHPLHPQGGPLNNPPSFLLLFLEMAVFLPVKQIGPTFQFFPWVIYQMNA